MRNKIKQAFKKQVNSLLLLLCVGGTCISALSVTASALADEASQLREQRALFLQTERDIKKRRFTAARENMAQLHHYALYPYLEAAFLKQNLSLANEQVISEFLSEFYGTPIADKLRTPWLEFLASKGDKERFLTYYQGGESATLQCQYLDYLWKTTNNLTALWPQVSNQWLSGHSQPKQCDDVFNAWAEAGMRTSSLVWQRFDLALKNRQYSLARYLTRQLPEDVQYLAQLSRSAYTNPATIMRFDAFVNKDKREKEILLPALHKLVWRNIDDAMLAWAHYQTIYEFSDAETSDMNERFGITLSLRGEPEAVEWLEKVPAPALSDSGQQWLLAALLRSKRFDRIIMLANALPENVRQKDQWRYWRGRALIELNFNDDGEEELAAVAQNRSYYGFLSSARLGVEPSLANEPVHYDADKLEQLKKQPSVQRAKELYALERTLDARREWNVLAYHGNYDEQVLSAVLAYEYEFYDQAILGLARTGLYNDVEKRFPVAYQELLLNHADDQNLDAAWVYAIVRRESAFRSDAISPVGARGLMQVMPDTASYLTRKSASTRSIPMPKHRLLAPEINVELGTRYLNELLGRTGNNWIVATAAYNAGINKVVDWLPEEPIDFDVWVETMPYQETRDYVKAVLAYQQIYTILLGKDDNVLVPLISLQMYAEHRG